MPPGTTPTPDAQQARSRAGFSLDLIVPMGAVMSAAVLEQMPPAYLTAPQEVQLRDVAELNRQIEAELTAGTAEIHVVGVISLSYASQAALQEVARRLNSRGVFFEVRRR